MTLAPTSAMGHLVMTGQGDMQPQPTTGTGVTAQERPIQVRDQNPHTLLAKGSHNNYFGSSGRVAGWAGLARIV